MYNIEAVHELKEDDNDRRLQFSEIGTCLLATQIFDTIFTFRMNVFFS